MNILLLLLNFLVPTAEAAITTCTGGAGNDYGGMSCIVPTCDISFNPALGCSTAPTTPAGTLYGYRCYLNTYVNRMCTYDSLDTTCYPITAIGLTNFCNVPPVGKASPSVNPVSLTDGSTVLNCRELSEEFVEQFCKVW